MTPTDPRHGSHAGFIAGCRDDCCETARFRARKQRELTRLAVGPLVVPADRARAHIGRCLRYGMPLGHIAHSSAQRIWHGDHDQILRSTEAVILAAEPQPGVNCFPAHGAVRRLQALIALGYRQDHLAAETGISTTYLSMLITGYRSNKRLEPRLWQSIADTYERLAMSAGDSNKSRLRAHRNGWAVPLAWDDIDDPDEKPHLGRDRKQYDNDELVAEWEHLRSLGVSIEQAAAQLGMTVDGIQKALRVHAHQGAA